MSMITGTFRGGHVELDRPPTDWVEGSSVTVLNSDCGAVDIRGDSPSAIAAWMAWYDDLLAMPKSDEAAEELLSLISHQ